MRLFCFVYVFIKVNELFIYLFQIDCFLSNNALIQKTNLKLIYIAFCF